MEILCKLINLVLVLNDKLISSKLRENHGVAIQSNEVKSNKGIYMWLLDLHNNWTK